MVALEAARGSGVFFWLPAHKAGARKLFPFTVHVAAPHRPISFRLCSLFSSKMSGEPNLRPRGRSHSGQGAPRGKRAMQSERGGAL